MNQELSNGQNGQGGKSAGVSRHRALVVKLVVLAVAFFGFGLALVPLYNSFCKAVGFNGKTSGEITPASEVKEYKLDASRTLTVQFSTTLMAGLPWDIRPLEPSINVHPGELRTTRFLVRNTSDKTIVGQAVPSISPIQAAQHFHKLECFCFKQQSMAPGESREMPLTFIINPEIDSNIRELTLAYAFFPAPTNTTTGDKP